MNFLKEEWINDKLIFKKKEMKDLFPDNTKKVIIIGNGPSVMNYNLGKIVNNFDIVVRLNNYKIDGFEDKIGNKTDVWINCLGTTQVPRKVGKKIKVITFCMNYWDYNSLNRIHKKVPVKIINRKESEIYHFENLYGFMGTINNNRFTTGMSSIIIFSLYFKYPIFVYGFDFYKSKQIYYYTNINPIIKKHDHDSEYEIFKILEKENKIYELKLVKNKLKKKDKKKKENKTKIIMNSSYYEEKKYSKINISNENKNIIKNNIELLARTKII